MSQLKNDTAKDTIYIDVDDEITGIIDKLRSSQHKVVALVLPKRASVFQSIVNMKLLRKTADDEKKNVVLITSEASLLPLAGAVGVHVAKTLQSKPAIPPAPAVYDEMDSLDEPVDLSTLPPPGDEKSSAEFDPETVADKPVGELAGLAVADQAPELPIPPKKSHLEADDSIDIADDSLIAGATGSGAEEAKKQAKKSKKDKKLKVPNFKRFRAVLFILFLLIIGGIFLGLSLLSKLDKATITIQTNDSTISSNLSLTLDGSAKTLDTTTLTVPATVQTVQKSNSAQVETTGQRNNGAAASGTVTMTACENTAAPAQDVPAGTGITSNGLTFITQSSTSFSHHGTTNGTCIQYQATNATQVVAQSGGSNYNIGSSTFTVSNRSDVSAASSSSMTGGTDSVIQIVTQTDIDSATNKLGTQDTPTIKSGLAESLIQAGLTPILTSFSPGTPSITSSPGVGATSNTVTVTQTITYTMFGVHESDLQTLVDQSVNGQINTAQQTILSDGVSSAVFNVLNQSGSQAQVTMQTGSTVGSSIDVTSLKSQVAGKKSGDVESIVKAYSGVTNVTTSFSPFWVSGVPTNTNHITVVIQKRS